MLMRKKLLYDILKNVEKSHMSIKIATLISTFTILVLCCTSLASVSHAQTSTSSDDAKKTTTSGGTLDVKLEPSPNLIKSDQETKYKVTFLQKGTDTVQVHIDYDFIILKDNTTEVFKASQQTGQPLLHTAEGIVTIPFTLEEPGGYTIRVPTMGINFIPMATEYADFPIKVQ
jgi:sensor histidine kinase regulating citrate/malate metabolism